jgi:EmrB/QacA subfamily drug resistance transporter
MLPSPARRTNRAVTVVGLVLALAMGALEATVVSTAMPSVVGDLGGIHLYAWVTTAYLLTVSVTVPLYGKLADVYGRKPVLLFGIAVFLLGSAASGAASSMTQLIAFRAVQGLGAGAMQPIALTVVGDIFDLEERARIQGVFGAAWGLFGMSGPALGGFFVKHLSWRWVFYINLPFGLASMLILVLALHEQVERRPRRLDVAGAVLLAAALAALLLVSSRSIAGAAPYLLPAFLVLSAVFFAVEQRAAEPVLPLPLFAQRLIGTASATGAIIGGAMLATVTYVPLFVQGVLRGDPTQAGSAFTPMLVGWPIASTLGGRMLPRVGFRPLIRAGLALTTIAGVFLALYGERGGVRVLQAATGVFGVGMGLSNTALLIAVQTSVAWEQRGVATASTMFFRNIGGALAVSAMGGLLNAVLLGTPGVDADLASRVFSPEGLKSLARADLDRVSGALATGIGYVFWIVAGIALTAFVTSLWFPYLPTAPRKPRDAEAEVELSMDG